MEKNKMNDMEKLISLCKRRGFIYQGSEIYGGLAGTFDYGPLGVALKNNIQNLWWKRFVLDREDMYGVDAAILMNAKVWEATGHVATFADPLVDDLKTKKRYRADHLLEENGIEAKKMTIDQMTKAIQENGLKSPEGNPLSEVKQFNMMFKTRAGASEDSSSVVYLRPETAQGMFVNFKNVIDSFHPKLPFGLGQVGKSFRNEITPGSFVFRLRELEQMEIEYFIRAENWEQEFKNWLQAIKDFLTDDIGLQKTHLHEYEHSDEERSFYSKRTVDIEFDYPFGQKELYGLAYRTDYDLTKHGQFSGADLTYFDEETKQRFVPHVIEPALGLDRTCLAALSDAYTEDVLGDEARVYLKLAPKVSPFIASVFPLLKNKPALVEKAREIYATLRKEPALAGRVSFDDNGNIGKRYRRQDEIGTPFCVTIDFDTLGEKPELLNTVTLRDRDTGGQKRVSIDELASIFKSALVA
ncbi:MAG: glycine--tRNA ligase [Candidatus Pacebacteria bacterium]|nr:glycine--tRNA ligase [Candidatus Paceibacterota bacterium]